MAKVEFLKNSYIHNLNSEYMNNLNDSFKTPTGLHSIREKIGDKMPIYTIFKGRKTISNDLTLQDFYKDKKAHNKHFKDHEDVITSRILRLKGEERDVNLGGNVDSFLRYI